VASSQKPKRNEAQNELKDKTVYKLFKKKKNDLVGNRELTVRLLEG